MNKFFFIASLFFVFLVRAEDRTDSISFNAADPMPETQLNIADAVPDGSRALTEAVLDFGEKSGSASVYRVDPANALRGLEAGKFQAALIAEKELPPDFSGTKIPAFIDCLAAYVSVENPLRETSSETLRKAWLARRPQWKLFGGGFADIHRYAMLSGRPGGGIIQDMLGVAPPATGVTMLNLLSEPLLFVSSDEEALALVRFQSEYPVDSVRVLAVDGVVPSKKNILNGTYKLTRRYVWVFPSVELPAAAKFIECCRGYRFRHALEEENLLFEE